MGVVPAGRTMAGPIAAGRRRGSAVVRVLRAPFTRRARADLGYALVSFPLAVAGCLFTGAFFTHPLLLALLPLSTLGVRRLAGASRLVARGLLGEDIPGPPPLRRETAGVRNLWDWQLALLRDRPGWRARGYLALKLPVSLVGMLAVGCTWLTGLVYLTYPIWWEIFHRIPITVDGVSRPDPVTDPGSFGVVHVLTLPGAFLFIPVGAALLLVAPWLTHQGVAVDRLLMRRLLGPASLADRVRDLEETRAQLVDDSAARLRRIERDLHDGTQAQLVGLAMKLGLAREKLGALAAANPADLDRAAELVDAAHSGAIEAIAELRTLVRGIHPPVLDNGLADALATLASRSAVPVELITDIPERPSAAIETIAYFCAAELLANVAKHSGARHAVVEAVHVPGLLRIRVRDDGHGGARPEASGGGGLRGLADRIRPVDGRMDISSPRGGPTVVTVELPSRA